MPINVGSIELCDLGDVVVGSQQIQEAYAGDQQTFPCGGPGPGPIPDPTGLCLNFDDTLAVLPMGDLGDAWEVSMEVNANGSFAALCCENPADVVNTWFAIGLRTGTSTFDYIDWFLQDENGQIGTDDPMDMPQGEWIRVTIARNGTNGYDFLLENLNTAESISSLDQGQLPQNLVFPPNLALGRSTHGVGAVTPLQGLMRNVIFKNNGLIVSNWPIQNYITAGGVILDISGNGNDGAVSEIGGGSIGACP